MIPVIPSFLLIFLPEPFTWVPVVHCFGPTYPSHLLSYASSCIPVNKLLPLFPTLQGEKRAGGHSGAAPANRSCLGTLRCQECFYSCIKISLFCTHHGSYLTPGFPLVVSNEKDEVTWPFTT